MISRSWSRRRSSGARPRGRFRHRLQHRAPLLGEPVVAVERDQRVPQLGEEARQPRVEGVVAVDPLLRPLVVGPHLGAHRVDVLHDARVLQHLRGGEVGGGSPAGRRSASTPPSPTSRRAAGVGASTVSRVLNGGQVSGAHARARPRGDRRARAIAPWPAPARWSPARPARSAMVIPFFTHPSAVERVRGVLAAIDGTAFELIVCNVAAPPSATSTSAGALRWTARRPAPRLALPATTRSPAFERAGVPVVARRRPPPAPAAPVDRRRRAAARWPPATCSTSGTSGSRSSATGREPGLGFVSSAAGATATAERSRAAGVPVRRELRRGARTAGSWRTGSPASCSARRSADRDLRGVRHAGPRGPGGGGRRGPDVPGDLSVVGFDDLEVAAYVGLTTVRQPLEDSGRRGVERLVAALHDHDVEPREEGLELELTSAGLRSASGHGDSEMSRRGPWASARRRRSGRAPPGRPRTHARPAARPGRRPTAGCRAPRRRAGRARSRPRRRRPPPARGGCGRWGCAGSARSSSGSRRCRAS